MRRLIAGRQLAQITAADVDSRSALYLGLSEVNQVNAQWRARRVGRIPGDGHVSNDPRFMRLTQHAQGVLTLIGTEFQRALSEAGISNEWDVRFVVTDLLRTAGVGGTLGQLRAVTQASENSPHTYGIGIDISNQRFDIIHKQSKEFFMTETGPGASDIPLVGVLNSIMGRVLLNLHRQNRLVLTYEPATNHYHITALTLPPPEPPQPAKKKVTPAPKKK
jgi:hypothetical protein